MNNKQYSQIFNVVNDYVAESNRTIYTNSYDDLLIFGQSDYTNEQNTIIFNVVNNFVWWEVGGNRF